MTAAPRHVRDADLMGWYQTDWLSANLRTPIATVALPDLEYNCDIDSK